MSDREGPSGADDELTLPKATVYKCIQELLPPELTCSKETRDLIIECCVEFIHMISTEANDICEKESRKTISPEHVVGALKLLGFEDYLEEVQDVLKEHKQQLKDREKKVSKFEASGLTLEELQAQQDALFEASRLKYAGAGAGPSEPGPSIVPPAEPSEA
ncbi:negative cofactor 2 transcription regulator complex subunit ncb2 [Tulasnella sp. JGI-2019a]|nr:negative cofactor 2 transcription regulator complex subunit ncb2 [Tulasnella sp. JGI-2019a]KAG9008901.1 negative cofactor 2 transcription regulator complex subunit ncb2 [Tulasnella sp. JGI-2019a]KAG9038223.1 negative cofactor 2 transcription regulator complex subunit ncb2 [Tulasnella sp. JGI-2019a]